MIKLAVIADDLTGCNDTGLQFAGAGLRTVVVLDAMGRESFPEKTDVLVLDTDSRGIDPASACERVSRVSRLLIRQGITRIYKKVDSTLRGNLGREIQAVAEVFDPEIVVIAPAFPRTKRTTIGGCQTLDGIPLNLTEIAGDPKSPVLECCVIELLRTQTDREMRHVPLHVILDGLASIRKSMWEGIEENCSWFVFDAETPENLARIAEAAFAYSRVLWVGSAGLAEHLPALYGWSRGAGIAAGGGLHAGPVLVVAGSLSGVTKAQVAYYLAYSRANLVTVDPIRAIEFPGREESAGIGRGSDLLRTGRDLVLTVASGPQFLRSAVETGARVGLSATDVSDRIAQLLGRIAARLATCGLGGIFLTGGDTASSVCKALHAGGISILRGVAPGIPLGTLLDGPHAGMKIVTKAGAFGSEKAIARSVEFIKE